MSATVVVGLDVGGTSTRATALTLTGERLGTGRGGGGNPTSHGAEQAAAELLTALRGALHGVDPARVHAGAIGLAGAGRLRADPAGRATFDRAWTEAGLRCPYAVHGDALVAYASGTAATDGTILIAGTGAIAAQVRDLRLDRIADGHGWLLGDAGSGFWLGREAVRTLLADLDAGTAPGPLGRRLLGDLIGATGVAARPRDTVDAVVQAVTRRPPVALARLAPLVVDAAVAGEPVATGLLHRAAAHLVDSAARVRPADAATPVVLGGGLLTGHTPLGAAVRTEAGRRWPDAPVQPAGDGAAGAAWLAARTLPEVTDPVALHTLLVPSADRPPTGRPAP
ncbi:N-acetylglucosamine kinase [Micromonospora sp. HUAS LYJ1]|uniref:N-acetylglucosamine kinase n=1 Tax=Micromonospora sp. HUAS LYJ1 TaxID=3061626 RepID=UPI002670D4A5|nr:BadF/BadG/BcrA/BcrD ATPase family protein [Micromonospora sp. HUAS LYJ1]WKU07337.1 BadF/BadG/BcrA/BcrD ATPase family protein [Micromonospora sp. HUAS LYJ1]